MYMCMHAHMYVCLHVCMYVCMYISMYVYMYVWTYVSVIVSVSAVSVPLFKISVLRSQFLHSVLTGICWSQHIIQNDSDAR